MNDKKRSELVWVRLNIRRTELYVKSGRSQNIWFCKPFGKGYAASLSPPGVDIPTNHFNHPVKINPISLSEMGS